MQGSVGCDLEFFFWDCLGAALARLELRCAFPPLFVRLEDLAPTIAAQDVVYMPSYVIRCPQRLPVTSRPSIA
ncbi:hypothetical protein [Sinorhizobium meliloti]|uniref:hypothetical protein n=1 Tax=Rhizobium meliloti TaxID=382 RepID=UPI0003718601|nr:hypothetical protein [Sinorhizobium meliloti]